MKKVIAKLRGPASRIMALASMTVLFMMGMGCATANVDVLSRPANDLVFPDYVLVYDLAVTPGEVAVDHGFIAQAVRDATEQPQSQSQLEIQMGHAVAKALTDGLVENLRLAGIRAGAARDGYKPTDKTLVVYGKFVIRQVFQGHA